MSETRGRLANIIKQHLDSIEALRELADEVAPRAAELDARLRNLERTAHTIKTMVEPERSRFIQALTDSLDLREKLVGLFEDTARTSDEEALKAAREKAFEEIGESNLKLFKAAGQNLGAIRLVSQILSSQTARLPILLRSLVVTAVSSFEVLLAGILTEYFRQYPGAMGTEEKEFSLSDLKILGSVDDAIEAAVERRVEGLVRNSFDEWQDWFKKSLKIDFKEFCFGWSDTREVFYRRNLLVHNAGRVNKIYLAKMGDTANLQLGEVASVDEEYLHRSLDRLEALGLILGILCWSKIIPDEIDEAAHTLAHANYERFMMDGRWEIVRLIAHSGRRAELEGVKDRTLRLFDFNGLLAEKRLGVKEVAERIASYDASALGRDFQLAQLCLLDRQDEALNLLEKLLKERELDLSDAEEWPILEEVRGHPEFDATIRAVKEQLSEEDGPDLSSSNSE